MNMIAATLTPFAEDTSRQTGTTSPSHQMVSDSGVTNFDCYVWVGCDRQGQAFVAQQYTAYPFRLSCPFRLDEGNDHRIYLYLMNSAPGLFAGDDLTLGLRVDPNAHLYLTDQSATKVHKMPGATSLAQLSWQITVGAGASLEFVPEPLILYTDAQLYHATTLTLTPTSSLFLSEIIVPGRLARSEYYQFREYRHRLQVRSSDGALLFGDTLRLTGQSNAFKDSLFFAKYPLIANIFIVSPDVNLDQLSHQLTQNSGVNSSHFITGVSSLPNCNGLLIKVMGDRIDQIQAYIRNILSCVRQIKGEPNFPHVPK